MKRPREQDQFGVLDNADRNALADSQLYHLHAAYTALLSNDQNKVAGLPIVSSIHARKFLSQLDSESDTGIDVRATLPPASTLDASFNALPTHWIQHNPLCPRCACVCIPGITWSHGLQACLNCYDGRKIDRPTADLQAQSTSKKRFASVRARKRGRVESVAFEPIKAKVVPAVLEPGKAHKEPAPILHSSPSQVESKQPRSQIQAQSPKLPSIPSKSQPHLTKPQPPPQADTAQPTDPKRPHPPSMKSKSINATTSSSKQDHKAALRSLLMKDAKKKKSGGGGEEKRSAGTGGLRDFLADL